MKRKGKVIIALLAVAAVAVVGVMAYMYLDTRIKIEPRQFVKEKETVAKKLYDKIMIDLEENYPTSPEGVMDLFNDAFYLMYSKSIVNDGTLLEVMSKQRELYSEELKSLNPETLQFSNLKSSLEELYDGNNICLSVERKGTVYGEKPGECVVQVMIYYNTLGSLYRNYYLIQDDAGCWKVNAWQMTDEIFSAGAD